MIGGLGGEVDGNMLAYISKHLDKGIEIVILLSPLYTSPLHQLHQKF
jgi:hypothetical protein